MMTALRGERGAVTAETAVVLTVVSALLLLIAQVGAVMADGARLHDGASATARAAMRGEDDPARDGRAVAGDGAQFSMSRSGDLVTVRATKEHRLAGGLLGGLSLTLRSEATARLEPHLAPGGAP
ncbi:TadE family type IV pilus minor pilin [Helcobacillus massiliensis]|uniref:Flp pilus assembly protein TadG n=1 Tax=Helcobacillus massiliensis TaxID=521392 RepID=A0A839QU93_9MICO|nr:TadE family type IV pilus minor pilin [Helcobacillus massiliensis]MBB3023208.1 Flp pilus assembly protein TadG [Helcobacillus massiliensis]